MTDYGTQHRREFILRTVEQQKAAELLYHGHLRELNPDAERLAFRSNVLNTLLDTVFYGLIIFGMAVGVFGR